MSYDIITMEDCASNFGSFDVPGSKGKTYRVTLGGESYAHCPCEGFKFRKDCSHIKYVWEHACLYNPQWHTPDHEVTLQPVDYDEGLGFNEDGHCPSCGGPTMYVRRAV